jgi:hypothetical protein
MTKRLARAALAVAAAAAVAATAAPAHAAPTCVNYRTYQLVCIPDGS